jgi:hypothetical protein
MERKIIIVFFILLVMCCFSCSEFKSSESKSSINLRKYKGVILVGRQPTYGMLHEPVGSYVVTFRRNDSIWSEIYRYEVLESFNVGDTLK